MTLIAKDNSKNQALFGIVQGGRVEKLRKESATVLGEMDFDGYGIGGSFEKSDMDNAVQWVNEILPEENEIAKFFTEWYLYYREKYDYRDEYMEYKILTCFSMN
jgi:hypothetical protein